MNLNKLHFIAIAVLVFGLTEAVSAQKTYWLGTKTGYELTFNVRVPDDVAAVIMHEKPAPRRGNDTKPRYRRFSQNVGGKATIFHANDLGWETQKMKTNGALTWFVDVGWGADWRNVNAKDPLWNNFTNALIKLSIGDQNWSRASVIMAESTGTVPPAGKLNLDGTVGKPSAGTLAQWKLAEMNAKPSLSPGDLAAVRKLMLDVANDGRANTNYRQSNKTARSLRAGLTPLQLNEKLNAAAQNQSDYMARTRTVTHDQNVAQFSTLGKRMDKFYGPNPGHAEAAGAGSLQEYPTAWMKSETHYRPWWDLDGKTTTHLGYGISKGSDGKWYMVAVFLFK
jgi:uncharacterized protein YkwD